MNHSPRTSGGYTPGKLCNVRRFRDENDRETRGNGRLAGGLATYAAATGSDFRNLMSACVLGRPEAESEMRVFYPPPTVFNRLGPGNALSRPRRAAPSFRSLGFAAP